MSAITWGPEIAVDGKRPEWLDTGPCKAFIDSSDAFHGWTDDWEDTLETDPAGWKWVKDDGSPRITRIRLPANHPHYATQSHPTAPIPSEVGPEVVERLQRAVQAYARNDRGLIASGKSVHAELVDLAGMLPEPVDEDLIAAREAVMSMTDRPFYSWKIRDGEHDDSPLVQGALAAIKHCRALVAGDR